MSITHASGLARQVNCAIVSGTFYFSLLAMAALAAIAFHHPDATTAVSAVVYGACLVACSLCSYMYTIRIHPESRRIWRHLDHAAIFLLIAGTYTPFALTIIGPFGIPLVYSIWVFALAGLTLRLIIRRGYERLFIGLYLIVGWLFVTAITDVIRNIDHLPLMLLAAGAAAYSVGAVIFARDIGRWTDPIWHSFVFIGSYLHFLAVLDMALTAA